MDIGQIGNSAQPAPVINDGTPPAAAAAQAGQSAGNAAAQVPQVAQEGGTASASGQQVSQAVDEINKVLQSMSAEIRFSLDSDDSNQVIVKVINPQTNEVIRQIPSAEALAISKSLEKVQGLLIHQKA